jgi:hypothetical protein
MKLFHNSWEKWAVITLLIVIIIIGLSGCNYRMIPYETQIEYGTTETDSKNNKLQEKRFIIQKWRWK